MDISRQQLSVNRKMNQDDAIWERIVKAMFIQTNWKQFIWRRQWFKGTYIAILNVSFSQIVKRWLRHSQSQNINRNKQSSRKYCGSIYNQHPNIEITIAWIPGHEDIARNEKTNQEIKKATQETQETQESDNTLKSARNDEIQKILLRQWQKKWERGTDNTYRLCNISRRPEMIAEAKLYQKINNWKHVTWIARLRIDHCSLNKYLCHFNIIDELICECGEKEKPIEHYLLKCQIYDKKRDELRKKGGDDAMRAIGEATWRSQKNKIHYPIHWEHQQI